MNRKAHWDTVYTEKQHTRVSWFQPRPEISLALIDGVGLDAAAPIIDVGGGASRLVDHLIEGGFTDISVLDVSATALEVTRRRLGDRGSDVRWIDSDITKADLTGPFDVWHDRAVFHFLTDADDRAEYHAVMSAALHPGSHAIIATFAEDGPTVCSGLPIVRYSAESLSAELGQPFELLETRREMHLKPAGGEQSFVYGLFRRK